MNPLFLTDGYKTDHHNQYPKGTNRVYSNLTPRSFKHAPKGCDKVIVFGIQMFLRRLQETFQKEFFDLPKDQVCTQMKEELSLYLNQPYDVSHFEALHDLGYLPIRVKALPEGSAVDPKIPVLTIVNTKDEFYWVTNYLETVLSSELWKPMTSASIAFQYKKLLTKYATMTDPENLWIVDFQAHDFSMRGLSSHDAVLSGLGHATSFLGSDTLPVIPSARKYYDEKEFIVGSVNATEHSVMCAGGKESELETFKRLLDTHPTGILSVVSDTWDLWKVITEYLPALKDQIMSRDGKLVIRPDSGDPADIICGHQFAPDDRLPQSNEDLNRFESEHKGVIELLWDIFGGTTNEQGYKVLDSHIGAIYGDSITLQVAEDICERLILKGFATTNIVFGVGSYTYQYNTRDTFGFAMKATYVEIDNHPYEIFKDPVTDDGTKKSAKGLLCVSKKGDKYILNDQVAWDHEGEMIPAENIGKLSTVFENGELKNQTTLTEIRTKINKLCQDTMLSTQPEK